MQQHRIYIGELIRQKVVELHWSYADFARAINCARSSLYNLFNSKDISIEKLVLISRVLKYDFIKEVYRKDSPELDLKGKSFVAIPLHGDGIDTDSIPKEILEWLRVQLGVQNNEQNAQNTDAD